MRARDEGLLALDDPISRFVPETGYADATVGSLLAHLSGMQSEPGGSWWERSPGVATDVLLRGQRRHRPVADAGAFYHYSNLGFALLGEAVARLRGASWWDVVTAELLEPLGMTRTTYLPVAPHAQGYSVVHFTGELTREPHQDTVAMAPAGQAWSTVTDLLRWADFLATGHPDVLARETLDEMASLQPPSDGYGLGLRLMEVDGRACAGTPVRCPASWPACSSTAATRDACVLMTNATSGIGTEWCPGCCWPTTRRTRVEPWRPIDGVPESVAGVPGLWFWGNTARELRWHHERLRLQSSATPTTPTSSSCAASGSSASGLPPRRDPARRPPRDGSVTPGVRDVRLHPGALRPGRRHPRRPPLTASRRRSP